MLHVFLLLKFYFSKIRFVCSFTPGVHYDVPFSADTGIGKCCIRLMFSKGSDLNGPVSSHTPLCPSHLGVTYTALVSLHVAFLLKWKKFSQKDLM